MPEKKAGEFYTPYEVSLLMSEIVANHLRDKEKIEIYNLIKLRSDFDQKQEEISNG